MLVAVFLFIALFSRIKEGKEAFTVTCDFQISDYEDSYMNAGSGPDPLPYENFIGSSFDSFGYLLENLTSDHELNITCNVELSSVIEFTNLTNITITGHNNPIIDCNNHGGLLFTSCSNVTIEGIIWGQCGSYIDSDLVIPTITFEKTSNVMIKNSTFQHSLGQAVALTESSGIVIIDKCIFVNNSKYSGHGAVIYYSSGNIYAINISIINSHFQSNVGASSIIYLKSPTDSTEYRNFFIENSTFIDNTNVSFYVVNQNLHLNDIYFENKNTVNNKSQYYTLNSFPVIIWVSFLLDFSSVTFKGHSRVYFASSGSAFVLCNYSKLTFDGNSNVTFDSIKFDTIIDSRNHSSVMFKGNSTVTFSNNKVIDSQGVIYSGLYSSVIFDENSSVSFNSNTLYKGAIQLEDHSNVICKGISKVVFFDNTGALKGGALYLCEYSSVTFKENTEVLFIRNQAYKGGAIYSMSFSYIVFTGYSTVTLKNNTADSAGALSSHYNSIIVFNKNTRVAFVHNVAEHSGGAMDLYINAQVINKGNSLVTFDDNTVSNLDGACVCYSAVSFTDNATVNFLKNKAEIGGAIALSLSCNITFKNAQATFSNNMASYGAAIWMNITDKGSKINFDVPRGSKIAFYNNTALIRGNLILVDIRNTCNKSCFIEQVLGITNILQLNKQQVELKEYITTSPYKIVLQDIKGSPLICNELDDAYYDCKSYYLNDVMLGQEVSMKVLVYDYLNNSIPVEAAYEIHNVKQNTNYNIQFVNQISFQRLDVMITGNNIVSNYNYSLNITTSYTLLQQATISANLIIQLSPCYLGFQHDNESKKCECYDRENIVLCDENVSNIRRGYWLGTVGEKLTASICPINFCDFTCCETSNGYHLLSTDRADQCTPHRSGIACGSCEEGYTLSYDAFCVSVDRCTVGWIILVVIVTIIYWIAIVVGAFAMMYFKLPIGYLYAMTYYYSIADVLLGQYFYIFSIQQRFTFTATNIVSSVFKLSPQFLGQLCLVKGLSGIDVYFIQYVHPLVILLILVKIVLLARCSQRLSLFISKGIIHVICFLLLISYTSIVTISLLLIRSLTFYGVDKIYTYLSPDIEYFYGRHLLYFIVAVICVITVVIGLPLILLLEPFLNWKINFTRIKPLLDQFQGCFKDKYRWFASYYLICRLVQITLVVYSSDFFITQYILVITSVVTSLIHVVIRPYSNETLNVFDGIILHLMNVVAVIPVFHSFNSTSTFTITFVLIILRLPLLIFFIMGFIINKGAMRRLYVMLCRPKSTEHVVVEENVNERSMQEFDIIVDDSTRINATICDM